MVQRMLHQGTRITGALPDQHYRVWVHIEAVDSKEGTYEDIDWPRPLGTFATDEHAEAFVSRLALLINPDEQEQTR